MGTEWQEFYETISLFDIDTTLQDLPLPDKVNLFFSFGMEPCDIWIDDISLRVIGVD